VFALSFKKPEPSDLAELALPCVLYVVFNVAQLQQNIGSSSNFVPLFKLVNLFLLCTVVVVCCYLAEMQFMAD